MNIERVRIPEERIAPAIGSEGEVKERIERETGVDLDYNSDTGTVTIKGVGDNPLGTIIARDVIKAIGRGFTPKKAFKLFDEDSYLAVVDVTRYSGDSAKAKTRLKGRVIGRNGKTRKLLEEYAEVSVSIYGKTISFIGLSDRIQIVKKAVHMLLDGAPHSAVYNYLEEKRRGAEKPLKLWK